MNRYSWRFFCHFHTQRQLLWYPVCFPVQNVPSESWSTLKGKELLPEEEMLFFFSFRVDPFSEGRQDNFDKSYLSFESIFFSLNRRQLVLKWVGLLAWQWFKGVNVSQSWRRNCDEIMLHTPLTLYLSQQMDDGPWEYLCIYGLTLKTQ